MSASRTPTPCMRSSKTVVTCNWDYCGPTSLTVSYSYSLFFPLFDCVCLVFGFFGSLVPLVVRFLTDARGSCFPFFCCFFSFFFSFFVVVLRFVEGSRRGANDMKVPFLRILTCVVSFVLPGHWVWARQGISKAARLFHNTLTLTRTHTHTFVCLLRAGKLRPRMRPLTASALTDMGW